MNHNPQTRRAFLTGAGAVLAGFGVRGLARPAFARRRDAKPNIVLFISDDHGVWDSGPYGGNAVKTPHLSRLAGQSLRFTHAFAGSPTCAPSRSVMYTGLMPMRNGAHPNHSAIRPGVKTLPDYMKPLGYTTALIGKVHVKPEPQFPFDTLIKCGDNVLSTRVEKWLRGRPKNKPFCLIVATHDPHVPWRYDPKYGYDREVDDLPSTLVDTPETRQARADYYSDVTRMDERLGMVLSLLDQHGLADHTVFLYTADQGAQWPFAKWNLYDVGIRVPLLVRWPGRIRSGTVSDAMVSQVDLLATFIEMAGGAPPESLDSRSFLKVLEGAAATHRDIIYAAHTGDGDKNRTPMRCVRTRRTKYILNLSPEIEYTTHIDIFNKQGYWESWEQKADRDTHAERVLRRYRRRPREELYDLVHDPNETNNLVGDPDYADVLEALRTRMTQWREQQNDTETGPAT